MRKEAEKLASAAAEKAREKACKNMKRQRNARRHEESFLKHVRKAIIEAEKETMRRQVHFKAGKRLLVKKKQASVRAFAAKQGRRRGEAQKKESNSTLLLVLCGTVFVQFAGSRTTGDKNALWFLKEAKPEKLSPLRSNFYSACDVRCCLHWDRFCPRLVGLAAIFLLSLCQSFETDISCVPRELTR